MDALLTYIPMDRRHALAQRFALPDRTTGAALFADISGFTALTEALVVELGAQRGAEELTRYLNLVYDAIVNEVHRYRGSVIAFAGDAITCWFDGDEGLRATACALAMQTQMSQFAEVRTPVGSTVMLAMKAAVAAGTARRFLLGDPAIRLIDVLAGETLERLSSAEHQARKGDVVLDHATAQQLGEAVQISEWRTSGDASPAVAVIHALSKPVDEAPWPALAHPLSEAEIQPWLLQPVYERLRHGLGDFLAELRPTVALFVRFVGIDYDHDPAAGETLDSYIRWVQAVVDRYAGTLIDVNMGDKGSYLYINFGAPLAHEDNAARAAAAALELRQPPAGLEMIRGVQIGISQGRMRAGAYGGSTHRTYGVLGDEVNMAARLMMAAAPGQILVSEIAQRTIASTFVWEALPPMRVKGKREPATVFALLSAQETRQVPLTLGKYTLPLVARQPELAELDAKLRLAQQSHGQIVSITSEAGLGKTRLVAELVQHAQAAGVTTYVGVCESFGIHSSYLVWEPIWRGLFGLEARWPLEQQSEHLQQRLAAVDPLLAERCPLLGSLLNLSIPENELTRSLDAKMRKQALETLLVDYLRGQAWATPLLLVLEDGHWLDPLSHDLLEVIGQTIVDLPVLIVLNYRPVTTERLRAPRVSTLAHHTTIELVPLSAAESAALLQHKLEQLVGRPIQLDPDLADRIVKQAEGNPFYMEELVNYLHYQGLDEGNESGRSVELPDSLQRLVLSRMDQLSEQQKITIKVASVIGRIFKATWLPNIRPDLGDTQQIYHDLWTITRHELTVLDPTETELTYLFKQAITQGVAYESLPYAVRAAMHEQIGQFIERAYPEQIEQFLDLLAYHYDHSENAEKRVEYLLRAGQAAQKNYANSAAIDYYQRAMPLLPGDQRLGMMLKLGQVLELDGQWQAAEVLYQQALALASETQDARAHARYETAIGELYRKQGHYEAATQRFQQARGVFEAIQDQVGVGQVLHYSGTLAAQQGDYETARQRYQESLLIRRGLGDQANIASLLSNLGILARFQNDYTTARTLHEESLAIRRAIGDRWAIANSYNNLALVLRDQHENRAARAMLEESLRISRAVGDKWSIANTLTSLAEVALDQADQPAAAHFLAESLTINRALGEQRAIAFLLESFAVLAATQTQPRLALQLAATADTLRQTIGAPLAPADAQRLEQALAAARQQLSAAAQAEAEALGRTTPLEAAIRQALDFTNE